MPPQLTSSSEIPRLAQRTLPVLLGLALVGIAPACTLIGVEPDEIDLVTGETGMNSDSLTSDASTSDSAGSEGSDSNTGDTDGGDGDGDPATGETGTDTDPATDSGSDSDTDTSGTGDTDTESGTDTSGDTEEPGGNCGELVEGELVDGSNELVLEQASAWEDPCGLGGSLGAYSYVASADGILTVSASGFPGGFSLTAYGPECAEEFLLSNACNADLDLPVLAGETIYLLVQVLDEAPVMGNLELTIN